jgi:hypothetical protein
MDELKNIELPDNTYTAFGSVGNKREKKIDPVEDLQKDFEQCEDGKKIEESLESLSGEMYQRTGNSPRPTLPSARQALEDYATQGNWHKDIMKAANHIDTVGENAKADDEMLNHTISNADRLSPEIHEQTRQALRRHPKDESLYAKYSWVFHHPESVTKAPEYNEDNAHEQFLNESDIAKYHKDFRFIGGRTVEDKVTRSRHHINQDGTLSPIGRVYGQSHLDILPFDKDPSGHTVKYHHDMLSEHYGKQFDAMKDYDPNAVKALAHYTEDSVPFNKLSAKANKGQEIGKEDKIYIGSNTHADVHHLDNAIRNTDPYPQSFKVYTGLSKSSDPSKAEETSPGRKTMHLPAFTSTTLHGHTAQGFSRPKPSEYGDVHDIVEIKVPKYHSGGAYVDTHSANPNEHEYLLTHGHVIEHDSTPKYYVSGNRMIRFWGNGEIKGLNQHPDWKLLNKTPEEMPPEVTQKMEGSHIKAVRDSATASEHASDSALNKAFPDGDNTVIRNVLKNKNLSHKSLTNILTNNRDDYIHKLALSNPNYDDTHATITIKHNQHLADKVLAHPNVSKSLVSVYSHSPESDLRQAAAASGKLDNDSMQRLANDVNPNVSRVAKLKLGKIEEEFDALISKLHSIQI